MLDVLQSDFYVDIETGNNREIDLVVYTEADYRYKDEILVIQISCCIECKLTKKSPWILFPPPSPVEEMHYPTGDLAFDLLGEPWALPTTTLELGKELLDKGFSQPKIQNLRIFNVRTIGYNLAQVHFGKGKGPDMPFQRSKFWFGRRVTTDIHMSERIPSLSPNTTSTQYKVYRDMTGFLYRIYT